MARPATSRSGLVSRATGKTQKRGRRPAASFTRIRALELSTPQYPILLPQ